MGRVIINTREIDRVIEQIKTEKWKSYFETVKNDFAELKEHYPFSVMINPPTQMASVIQIQTVAANKELIDRINATEEDFTKEFSRKLLIVVPIDYHAIGCEVYGAEWVDLNKLRDEDRHFYLSRTITKDGYRMCVGTPDSFINLRNVILENVKTAENMLIAYERFQIGAIDHLQLITYSHGEKGRDEYRRSKTKYISR